MSQTTTPRWSVAGELPMTVMGRLVRGSRPLMLCCTGPTLRDDVDSHSDEDLIVVETTVADRFEEMVRRGMTLLGLLLPVDLAVVSEEDSGERATLGESSDPVIRSS